MDSFPLPLPEVWYPESPPPKTVEEIAKEFLAFMRARYNERYRESMRRKV
jgi:hypothetical protein